MAAHKHEVDAVMLGVGARFEVWGDGEQTRSYCFVGVRGRTSDNSRLRKVLGWEPGVDLETGLPPTYRWIDKQVNG
jgi:nucleoside-diphosphate-sugar epimerase